MKITLKLEHQDHATSAEHNKTYVFDTRKHSIIKLGTLPSSHVVLAKVTGTSRMHAIIEADEQEVTIFDLGSAAGTIVMGKEIKKATRLRDKDIITLGYVRILVSLEET